MARLNAAAANGAGLRINEGEGGVVESAGESCCESHERGPANCVCVREADKLNSRWQRHRIRNQRKNRDPERVELAARLFDPFRVDGFSVLAPWALPPQRGCPVGDPGFLTTITFHAFGVRTLSLTCPLLPQNNITLPVAHEAHDYVTISTSNLRFQ